MRTFVFILLLTFISAQTSLAQEFNAGFVQGLWYSEEHVFAEKPVRIYVAIRNHTGSDLTGTVEFFDNNTRITRKAVQALDGRIIESWADWTPQYGEHTLSATLSRIELHKIGSSTQAVTVTSALADDVIFVDRDTDSDSIGNQDDADDDGDGFLDEDEITQGTNPLVADVVAISSTDEEKHEDVDVSEQSNSRKKRDASDVSSGLERYLADSPAENVLSSITTYIHDTKEDLDEYRTQRSEKKENAATATSTDVDDSGFGEVTRASSTQSEFNLEDFFTSLFKIIGTILNSVYTAVLAGLSFALAFPILIQVGLLLLILLLLFKFASKLGRRPVKK